MFHNELTLASFLEILQPILLLALEDYFNDPSVACLQRLYLSLNAMDTTNLPHLSLDERVILRTSERRDIFEEKFADSEPPPYLMRHMASNPSLSVSATGNSDESTEIIEGVDQHSLDSSGSLSSRASGAVLPRPGTAASSEDVSMGMSRTKSRANTISSEDGKGGWKYGTASRKDSDPQPVAASLRPKDTHWFDTKIVYGGHSLNIRLPLGTFPEEVGDVSFCNLLPLFRRNQH